MTGQAKLTLSEHLPRLPILKIGAQFNFGYGAFGVDKKSQIKLEGINQSSINAKSLSQSPDIKKIVSSFFCVISISPK